MDNLKETREYWKLKEEALDRTVWRTRFGRGCGPVVSEDYAKLTLRIFAKTDWRRKRMDCQVNRSTGSLQYTK